jgi:hypothetical protein
MVTWDGTEGGQALRLQAHWDRPRPHELAEGVRVRIDVPGSVYHMLTGHVVSTAAYPVAADTEVIVRLKGARAGRCSRLGFLARELWVWVEE